MAISCSKKKQKIKDIVSQLPYVRIIWNPDITFGYHLFLDTYLAYGYLSGFTCDFADTKIETLESQLIV